MTRFSPISLLFLLLILLSFDMSTAATDLQKANHDCSKDKTCGKIPYPSNTGNITPDPIIHSPNVWSFVSEPKLHPMKITVNKNEMGTSPGFIFVAPYAFSKDAIYGQPGSLIMDNEGNPIWFGPTDSKNIMKTDFRVQTFQGKPVLTFWQGTLATPPTYTNAPGGSSEPGSCYYILDNTYRVIKTVSAKNGYTSDIHEFLLTPRGTALFLATKTIPMDLTHFGGPQNGFIQNFQVQEVDLVSDELLFSWSALDHIPLTDSHEPASSATESGNIWDAYHLNSVGLTDSEDDIIVSGRNTWTIYRINKPTGNIVWHLGGDQNDFTIASDAQFSWQHDARFLPGNVISCFDDNCCESSTIPPGTPPARGLLLQLNLINKTATLLRSYFHFPNLQVASQGNVQSLDNGNKFIGWGQSQYFSEFRNAGNTEETSFNNILYDAQMPGSNYTYRAYRHQWVGIPHYRPSIGLKAHHCCTAVYASWNGSTRTKAWQVFAGCSRDQLSKIKTVDKTGFETAIEVKHSGPYFRVKALNKNGKVIGVSKIINRNCILATRLMDNRTRARARF